MTNAKPSTTKKPRAKTTKSRKKASVVRQRTAVREPPVVRAAPRVIAPAKHRTYTFAVGRRKSAIARVRYTAEGSGAFLVNGKAPETYFTTFDMRSMSRAPLVITGFNATGDISVKVHGGGLHGQAGAVRLGLARVLVKLNPDFRTTLKRAGFLTRDPRVKERKKYGLKRARRAPQWQKR